MTKSSQNPTPSKPYREPRPKPETEDLNIHCEDCLGPVHSKTITKDDGSRLVRWSCPNCCTASEALLM